MAEKKSGAKRGAAARAPRQAKGAKKPAVAAATPRTVVARKVGARKVAAPKSAARAARKVAPRKDTIASSEVIPRPKAAKAARRAPALRAPALNEEDVIRSAKYLPRDLPARLFEEERFLFPESYGVNRVRLLVKDPDWLFAHWDVDPKSFDDMKRNIGERAMALSRLTLRVVDAVHGGSSDVLLPVGARGWYIRADAARRSYRAELGVTLPSGEFRRLAESNVVTTPRVGPSRERATRRVTFGQAARIAEDASVAQAVEDEPRAGGEAVGPWRGPSIDASEPGAATVGQAPAPGGPARTPLLQRPGASDAFRPGGASDVHRR